jgi:hypothetical protein
MVASTLAAAVVPAAVDAQVTADVADKKDNVIITSTESVESAEAIESLGSNDPKLTSGTPAMEGNQEKESAESTESIVSAESTESPVDNDVLKTSSTFHRRYHYPARYPQYYRRPVAFGGYYNRYPQRQSVNRYSYHNRQPVYYTRPTYSSPSHSYYNSGSSSSGYSPSNGDDSDYVYVDPGTGGGDGGASHDFGAYA